MGYLNIKKVCGFSVSSIHFSVMILPYINQELEKNKKIITILEEDLEKSINEILSKITLNKEAKEKINNLNWMATDIEKANIFEIVSQEITKEKNLSFIIYGTESYINKVNKIIDEKINNQKEVIQNNNLKITNCYKIKDFQENIKEILTNHEAIFNTSGEKRIEDIYHSA